MNYNEKLDNILKYLNDDKLWNKKIKLMINKYFECLCVHCSYQIE